MRPGLPSPHARIIRALVLLLVVSSPLRSAPAPAAAHASPGIPDTPDGAPATPPPPRRSWLDAFLARISPTLRDIDHRDAAIARQLALLPRPASGPTSEQVGFHSSIVHSAHSTAWVQVDLGGVVDFDRILIVPAHLGFGEHPGPGYGFPIRFRVESATDPDFSHPVLLADFSREPFPNPGDEPVFVSSGGHPARCIRVTALELPPRGQYHCFALGELFVLRGNRNLAAGRPVTANHHIDTPRPWDRRHLVDHQSILGPPVSPEPSPSNGYHSIEYEPDRDAVKWVTVDLGDDVAFDELRLLPARPLDWADRLGFGFPVRFRIDTRPNSPDPDAAWTALVDHTDADFPNPGDNPVVFPSDGRRARWVRVTVTRLWERRNDYAFALAELEVWSDDVNIALHAPVQASESHEGNTWSTRGLVDGFTSQHRLLPLGDWADGLQRRQHALADSRALEARRIEVVGRLTRRLILGTGGGFVSLALASAFLLHRARHRRQSELETVRRQIARDMHDDLGARLTELTFLSELARQSVHQPDRCEELNRRISQNARDLVGSLDELVWTVNPRNDSLPRLVTGLLRQAERLLDPTPIQCRIDAPLHCPEIAVSSDLRHHALLLLKEALNNAIRHAHPSEVSIRLHADSQCLDIEIADDGSGMPSTPPTPSTGNGIDNMRQRALALNGSLDIQPRQPTGTRIRIRLPLRNRRNLPLPTP